MIKTSIKFANGTDVEILGINIILGRLVAVIKNELTDEEVINLFSEEHTKKITHSITNQEWNNYIYDEILRDEDFLSICMKKVGDENA